MDQCSVCTRWKHKFVRRGAPILGRITLCLSGLTVRTQRSHDHETATLIPKTIATKEACHASCCKRHFTQEMSIHRWHPQTESHMNDNASPTNSITHTKMNSRKHQCWHDMLLSKNTHISHLKLLQYFFVTFL